MNHIGNNLKIWQKKKHKKMLPIYDILIKKLPKGEMDKNARAIFLALVAKCSEAEMEIIYGLILTYCIAEKQPVVLLPFNMQETPEGISVNFGELPTKLQNILNKFVCKICCSVNKEDVNWSN